MVANFGPGVLSTPAKHGFDLLAWVLPIGGVARRRRRRSACGARYWRAVVRATRSQPALPGLDPEIERRIDEELDRLDD